jgi:FKBP-type peptidyl-prolyl cis-trans isomerase
MPITNVLRILLALLLTPGWVAAAASLTGTWDIQGTPVIAVSFAKKPLKFPPSASIVQFREDGAYTAIPPPPAAWPGTFGQWRSPKGAAKSYKISYDEGAIVAGTAIAPFAGVAYRGFLSVLKQALSGADPTIQDVTVKSYADSGKLTRSGQLKGTNRLTIEVKFTNPSDQQAVTTRFRATIRYTGTQASAGAVASVPSNCCVSDDPAQNLADSAAYLAEIAKLPGIQSTPSGLLYLVLNPGNGAAPTDSSTVTVDYRGTLPDGTVFDQSTQSASFALGGVIAGFKEGLELMRVGGQFRLFLPPGLAYGAPGRGKIIKPNSALVFDVALSKVE